jgi:hypothetical protein
MKNRSSQGDTDVRMQTLLKSRFIQAFADVQVPPYSEVPGEYFQISTGWKPGDDGRFTELPQSDPFVIQSQADLKLRYESIATRSWFDLNKHEIQEPWDAILTPKCMLYYCQAFALTARWDNEVINTEFPDSSLNEPNFMDALLRLCTSEQQEVLYLYTKFLAMGPDLVAKEFIQTFWVPWRRTNLNKRTIFRWEPVEPHGYDNSTFPRSTMPWF